MLAINPSPCISVGETLEIDTWVDDLFKDESTEVYALSSLAKDGLNASLQSGNAPAVQAWCELQIKQATKRGIYRLVRIHGKLVPSPNG